MKLSNKRLSVIEEKFLKYFRRRNQKTRDEILSDLERESELTGEDD